MKVRYLVAVAAALGASAAALGSLSTAVVHIGVDDTGSFGVDNIINYLGGDGRFSTIDAFDVDLNGVPTAGQLSAYDSVLIVTDNRAGQLTGGGLGTQTGNVLDDYVIGGGRVVFSAFAGDSGIGVDGDILALSPHMLGTGNATAGVMDLQGVSHPVFDGVNSFVSSFANSITLSGNGILLSSYDSGTLGVLTTADDSVMFVNAFAATQDDFAGSDFGHLFANALALPSPGAAALFLVAGLAGRRRRS